ARRKMTDPKIVVEKLTKSFRKDGVSFLALQDVSIAVDKGSFVSIVGPSGCGKSTLLYILGGFVTDFSGRVEVDNRPVSGPGTDRGIVFQDYALFPWLNVFDNIAYGLRQQKVAKDKVQAVVE